MLTISRALGEFCADDCNYTRKGIAKVIYSIHYDSHAICQDANYSLERNQQYVATMPIILV